ncbi:MAG: putative DNA binding domain-containing protein [Methanomassiliicoccaceae archaeon]|nr:putative DNA binding domain-containing protein [Methanomassiliicoccaceae archaeon]
MPLPINIKELIEQRIVESARIEYKSSWNPEPIIHTICAFANDIDNWGGGYIVLGVEDDNGAPKLPLKGLSKREIDEINKGLLQKCNTIEPRYIPVVEQTQYNGKEVMVIWAPGGNDRPYRCPIDFPADGKKAKSEKAHYIRKTSNTIRANENDTRELFSIASDIPFDDRVNWNAGMEKLRHPLISNFLYEVGSGLYERSQDMSITALAESMRISAGTQESTRPLNVGLMFFNERPDDFFRYARIEVVDKPDPTGDGMVEKVFTGPLDRQLKDALAFISNYVMKEKILKHSDRAESDRISNYPFAAVEEILANAVYHKSYQVAEPITIVFTPDGMEVTSCPGPDRSISDDDLRRCRLVAKRTRNRRIGDFLKELRLVEGRNTGVPRILREAERNGSDPPVFETDAERSYLTVYLPVHRAFREDGRGSREGPTAAGDARKTPKPYRSRREIREDVLSALGEESMSRNMLARKLGYAKITDGLRGVLSELMAEGTIEHTIPDNPTDKSQRLRLTQRAKDAA